MRRMAIVQSGKVIDVVIAGDDYVPPQGVKAFHSETVNIGDPFADGKFMKREDKPDIEELLKSLDMSRFALTKYLRTIDLGNIKVRSNLLPETRTDLLALAEWGKANPDKTRAWFDSKGVRTELTGDQFVELSNKANLAYINLHDEMDKASQKIREGNVKKFDDIYNTLKGDGVV